MKGPLLRNDPDPGLIERAQGGDREALKDLLREITPAVQQWARAICREAADAEDLTQDVLILTVNKLPGFRGESRFVTWLYSVTRNQGLDAHRKRERQRRKMSRLETHLTGVAPTPPVPERQMDSSRLRELVSTFVGQLPDRQREVFQMADLQGLTPIEISRILKVRPGGVRAALHKARKTIRKRILDRHGEFVEEYLP